ncbi:hypothetical protein [Subtercola lobariae]|uniref:Uncharacterized protein n=1 Tax=Subtercola lobariae TaxID=1588641 RepID=A0A917ETM8_9MICO|nr:hypothetical protein [Subtercola lobariae]GGF10465.1 hypothetical protein GCM10011399_00410 [Subtercola lobariae]
MQPPRTAEVVNAEAVYGTVLISSLLYVFSLKFSAWDTLATTVEAVIVFFIAHVYAEIIANQTGTLSTAVHDALVRSRGLLLAAVVPLTIMLLAALGIVSKDRAVTSAVWASAVILGILGWFAVAPRSTKWWIRAIAALSTAGLGLVLVALKALTH